MKEAGDHADRQAAGWSVMSSRRDRRAKSDSRPRAGPPGVVVSRETPAAPGARGSRTPARKVVARIPKMAAISIKSLSEDVSYAEMLKKARASFSLKELGIESSKIREAANGGLLIEVHDQDGGAKADVLASRLRVVLGESAQVTRPIKMGEVKLSGFDISVSDLEIKEAIKSFCGCSIDDIRMGLPWRLADGTRAAWIKCPAAVASKLSEVGRLVVGWTSVKVEDFRIRPTQCFKCWHFGHVRNMCKVKTDRTGHCFKCGQAGHALRDCTSSVATCVVCIDNKLDGRHRLGSVYCPSLKLRGSGRVGNIQG